VNKTVVLIVGAVVIVGIVVAGYFMLLKPKMAQISALQTEIEAHNTYAAKKPQVQKQLADAQLETVQVNARMAEIYKATMPNISLAVPDWAQISLWYETGPGRDWFRRHQMGPGAEGTGTALSRFFRNEGIELPPTAIIIPEWGPRPVPATLRALPPLPLNLSFRVKSFDEFLKVFNKFERAPRFIVVQAAGVHLALDEAKMPYLQAEIQAMMYAWTKDAGGSAAPATPAPGAAPGGPPGMPGGPGAPGAPPGIPGMPPGTGGPRPG
jgi:hypothetical protein